LRLPYPLGTLCHHEGQALADGAAAAGRLPPDPTEGSLSTHRKAVGGSIPPDAGTYQAQQGKACHRQSNG